MTPSDDADWLPRWLGVPHARVVETAPFRLAADALEDICAELAMGAFTGVAGTGKTFSVRTLLSHRCSLPYTCVEFDRRPTMLSVSRTLLSKLGAPEIRGNKHSLIDPLVERLLKPRLIVIDEAQRLNEECIDHVRSLHDRAETNFAVALLGGNGCFETLKGEPMLKSRIWRWTSVEPMEEDEVIEHLPRYHALYEHATEKQLLYVDRTFAHGSFRDWAGFTMTVLRLQRRTGKSALDDELLHTALVKHGAL